MCAINPKHKKRMLVDVYTVENITKKEFEKRVLAIALDMEIRLNSTTSMRWHLKETAQEAK